MDVITKDAAVTAPDDAFPGTFEAILSAPTKDRDGETLLPEEWKQPLPDHITVDMDHEMSVAGTIGSAKPWIDEKGNLRISGRFASTPKAQEVRTLMQEGHINRTSVAFMSEKTQKDGVTSVQREVLNAAIVAIPSNREAVILSAKGVKTGARNSAADQKHLDAIHALLTEAAQHSIALGATPGAIGTDLTGGDTDADLDVAASKSYLQAKDAGTGYDPHAAIASIDAVVDQIGALLAGVDTTSLPPTVQQALDLVPALTTTVDELMDALGIPDPDDEAETAAETAPETAKAANGTAKAAANDESIEKHIQAARMQLWSTLTGRN